MKIKSRLYFLSVIILTALLSGIHTACLLTSYNGDVGYLDSTPLVLIMRILYVCGALWCLAIPLISPKEEPLPSVDTIPHIILSNLAGSLFLFSGVCLFINFVSAHTGTALKPFLAVFATLASIFFFTESKLSQKLRAIHAPCGFLVLGFLFCLLFHIYFDMYVTINSPLKTALQLSVLSAMLFTLFEIRAGIGKPMPRVAIAARLLCTLFCLPTAISHLVFGASALCGALEKTVIDPFFSLPLLAIGLFAASQLIFRRDTKNI